MTRRLTLALIALVVVAAGVLAYQGWQRRSSGLPRAGSPDYERTTSAFFSGVAALQVGLLDDALRYFTAATQLAPREPAAWGNLAVAKLRLSDIDGAGTAVNEALRLADDSADVRLLAARWEIARGDLDAGIEQLRRTLDLNPADLRARSALAEELERAGTPEQAAESLALLDDAVTRAPANVALLLERARIAAAQQNAPSLSDSVRRLQSASGGWSPLARTQLDALQAVAGSGDAAQTSRAVLLLRNALAREASFAADLAAVRTPPELIADAFDRFLRLPQPVATPAPPDLALRFTTEDLDPRPASTTIALTLDTEGPPVVFAADATSIWRVGDPDTALPFPGAGEAPGPHALLAFDWNNDFATDLLAAGSRGVRLFIQNDGRFEDRTAPAGANAPITCTCRAAWPADIEMDGDLDVVLGVIGGPTQVLRNNGDGMWTPLDVFAAAADVHAFAWGDLDADGDPDAVLQAPAGLRIFINNRAGAFTPAASLPVGDSVAMTVADLDADGRFDIVTSGADGGIRRSALQASGQWDTVEVIAAARPAASPSVLLVGDLDNNGAMDVVRSGQRTEIWLADERHALQPLPTNIQAPVSQLIDLNADGRLDLLATGGRAQRLLGSGAQAYHWKQIRVRAQAVAGDQRINPYAVGGEIDVRAGLLRQRQLLTGTPAHFGLGTHSGFDVARIVWPNGAPQVEFASGADSTILAEQRLKGSCPWVFAHDGTEMKFVTDFLWRSPLGLRINAQDTAGVSQTEDWVRLRGDQLAPHDGRYEVRITAELWETHFFDHVSLMVVDHPADREMVIDERFTPQPVSFAVTSLRDVLPVLNVGDDSGADVTPLVARRDGQHLATFWRGHYQGIAEDHAVTFDLPVRAATGQNPSPGASAKAGEHLVLVAQGWVYPTDSSINVAVGQGTRDRPSALSLEYQRADGRWVVAAPNLGFPAGKNKTMVIDLRPVGTARRVRLRTNMEVYWDALSTAIVTDAPVRTERLAAMTANLRYRGFSKTSSPRDHAPETPTYAPVGAVGQRWRDLVGFYTRFGDVRELIAGVDDRYVIMNAGDELALSFPVPPPPPSGWTRDFVLIGDGWEKDGDFNTEHSATVLPLPSHAGFDAAGEGRGAPATPGELENDPVYQRHRDDWERYHTRHVRPDAFGTGLMR